VDEGVHQMGRQLGTSNGLRAATAVKTASVALSGHAGRRSRTASARTDLAIGSIPGGPPGGRNDTPASSSAARTWLYDRPVSLAIFCKVAPARYRRAISATVSESNWSPRLSRQRQ